MSARHVAQTAVGMNRLTNPFDPIDPSILRAIEEMQHIPLKHCALGLERGLAIHASNREREAEREEGHSRMRSGGRSRGSAISGPSPSTSLPRCPTVGIQL